MKAIDEDLYGKTCLVTGANTGIGKEIARNLARMRATVVMVCRDRERAETARDEIVSDTENERVEIMLADLSSQAAIRDLGRRVLDTCERLHVLVNNAGILARRRELSVDGIEMTWATNVLAYFLLTNLLLDRLKESAPARIVNVASESAGRLDLDDVQCERRRFRPLWVYQQSKQANRMWSWALAERLENTGVTVTVAHPGPVATELPRQFTGLSGVLLKAAFRIIGRPPSTGADTPTWLAAAPAIQGETGKIYAKRKELRRRFYDAEAQARLWALCEQMTAPP